MLSSALRRVDDFDLPDILLISTLLLLLMKYLPSLPSKCLYPMLESFFSFLLICFLLPCLFAESVCFQLCLWVLLYPLPQAAVCAREGGYVCSAEQLVKGISKALSASQLIYDFSAWAGFHRILLH